jgi:hypothetical protein
LIGDITFIPAVKRHETKKVAPAAGTGIFSRPSSFRSELDLVEQTGERQERTAEP